MSIAPTEISPASSVSVTGALARASRATGVDFDYLLATAQRESSLNPAAKSKSSSASGLFQFVEQTWLGTLKAHGAEHGFADEAAAITKGPSGKLTVADPADRQAILALRNDPTAASLMAAELTRDSKQHLEGELGRTVSDSELYLAHFFGPGEASRFIARSDATPEEPAAASFKAAAAANYSIFYGSGGRARSFAEVKAHLTGARDDLPQGMETPAMAQLNERVGEALDVLFPQTEPTAKIWSPPVQALTLTPQVLAILSSLDPIPDSRTGNKGYSKVLSAQVS